MALAAPCCHAVVVGATSAANNAGPVPAAAGLPCRLALSCSGVCSAAGWLQTRKVKLAVQKFRTDIYRVALRMRVRVLVAGQAWWHGGMVA